MITSFRRGILGTIALTLVTAAAAQAQPVRDRCPYDECALRIRAGTLMAPPVLVRGAAEQEVVPLTPFGEPVAAHFRGIDSAYVQALRYDRLTPTAAVLNMAGTGILILSPMLFSWRDRPVASLTLFAGGLGMSLYGTHLANTATDALNRAIWWHNRGP
ncbi:MAG TPA: hypothetical protein VK928_04325 [Longimicrobiales bacterium]|nr:hypothetical protein [Longimicrobiales bacterium]